MCSSAATIGAYKYLLVVTDVLSKSVEEFPTQNDAKTVVKGLVKDIISCFGKPMGTTSGPAFNARRPQSPAVLIELQRWLKVLIIPGAQDRWMKEKLTAMMMMTTSKKWPDPQLCYT